MLLTIRPTQTVDYSFNNKYLIPIEIQNKTKSFQMNTPPRLLPTRESTCDPFAASQGPGQAGDGCHLFIYTLFKLRELLKLSCEPITKFGQEKREIHRLQLDLEAEMKE